MSKQLVAVGDTVRVKVDHVACHTRMPAYIRGKTGVVVGVPFTLTVTATVLVP